MLPPSYRLVLCVRAVPIPTTGVKLGGKAPAAAGASFVAPSANLVGAVNLGAGASAWYGSMLQGSKSTVEIGELSSVGDRAVVVDSVVGKCVHIGAGAIVSSLAAFAAGRARWSWMARSRWTASICGSAQR